TAVLPRPLSWERSPPALSLLLTLHSTSTAAHRSGHKAQFPPSSTPLNVSSLHRCSTVSQVYLSLGLQIFVLSLAFSENESLRETNGRRKRKRTLAAAGNPSPASLRRRCSLQPPKAQASANLRCTSLACRLHRSPSIVSPSEDSPW
ncbi:hypothetical protein PIB30_099142, partial [Stylosanthes scabra]|nr:hypothetical protein [Stylosanthes scabra]